MGATIEFADEIMNLYDQIFGYALASLDDGRSYSRMLIDIYHLTEPGELQQVVAEDYAPIVSPAQAADIREGIEYFLDLFGEDRIPGAQCSLDDVISRFDLGSFEIFLLLLGLAPYFDAKYAALFGYLQGDINKKHCSVGLALLWYGSTTSKAVSDNLVNTRSPFFRYIIAVRAQKDSLLSTPVIIHPRLVELLLGQSGLCDLDQLLLPVDGEDFMFGGLELLPAEQKLDRLLSYYDGSGDRAVTIFSGEDEEEKYHNLYRAAGLHQKQITYADTWILAQKDDYAANLQTLAIECMLRRSLVCLRDLPAEVPPQANIVDLTGVINDVSAFAPWVVVMKKTPWIPALRAPGVQYIPLQLDLPGIAQRRQIWERALGALNIAADDAAVAFLGNNFRMGKSQISHAASEAVNLHVLTAEAVEPGQRMPISKEILYKSCQNQFRNDLTNGTRLIADTFGWDDLILHEAQKNKLKNVVIHYRNREKVLYDWGFGQKLPYGRGISLLLYGAPGTGKTMAAQVIARELGLEIYKVDIPAVISKYIGETEKKLNAIFDEAQSLNVILLFDEADALFSKRTETKDSNDKYANMETSFLLQKIEEYEGITILTTNFRQNMDEAMLRRITYAVMFTNPDEEQRLRMWESMVPVGVELAEDVDFTFLAYKFDITGADIKNTLLKAAYLASDENSPISMRHLVSALKTDQEKYGRVIDSSVFRGYQ